MMEMLKKQITVYSFWVMLIGVFLIAALFTYLFFTTSADSQPKLSSFYAGLASAFAVALVQLLVSILEALKLQRYEKMGVINILKERRGREFYDKLISGSNDKIWLMGVSASRFMQDFAKCTTKDNCSLHAALSRNVSVKILLPDSAHLATENKGSLINITIPAYKSLREKFDNIEIRLFDHIPAHSIVLVDNTCIAGPVFKNLDSKDTPAIILRRDSVYAEPYIDSFESEWNEAKPIKL
jgi:hypothetical protein